MNTQNDPKEGSLQQGIAFHPDDPSRVSFRIQLDDLDHIAEQAPGILLGKEVRMEDVGELPLLDGKIIDTRSQNAEAKLDEDRAALSRPELEQAKIGEGVQEGVWLS